MPDGTFELEDNLKDMCNSHGFGAAFIDTLRSKKGASFPKALKEPMCKAKYTQHQINDMSACIKRNEAIIEKLQQYNLAFQPKIEKTLLAAEETNTRIDAFKKDTMRAEKVMNEI